MKQLHTVSFFALYVVKYSDYLLELCCLLSLSEEVCSVWLMKDLGRSMI